MSSTTNCTLRANCSAISFIQLMPGHTSLVVKELKEALEKKLLKMGIALLGLNNQIPANWSSK